MVVTSALFKFRRFQNDKKRRARIYFLVYSLLLKDEKEITIQNGIAEIKII